MSQSKRNDEGHEPEGATTRARYSGDQSELDRMHTVAGRHRPEQ